MDPEEVRRKVAENNAEVERLMRYVSLRSRASQPLWIEVVMLLVLLAAFAVWCYIIDSNSDHFRVRYFLLC